MAVAANPPPRGLPFGRLSVTMAEQGTHVEVLSRTRSTVLHNEAQSIHEDKSLTFANDMLRKSVFPEIASLEELQNDDGHWTVLASLIEAAGCGKVKHVVEHGAHARSAVIETTAKRDNLQRCLDHMENLGVDMTGVVAVDLAKILGADRHRTHRHNGLVTLTLALMHWHMKKAMSPEEKERYDAARRRKSISSKITEELETLAGDDPLLLEDPLVEPRAPISRVGYAEHAGELEMLESGSFVDHQKMEATMDSRVRARGLDDLVMNTENSLEESQRIDPVLRESRVGMWDEFSQTLDKDEPVTLNQTQEVVNQLNQPAPLSRLMAEEPIQTKEDIRARLGGAFDFSDINSNRFVCSISMAGCPGWLGKLGFRLRARVGSG